MKEEKKRTRGKKKSNFNILSSTGVESAPKPTQHFLVGFAFSSAVRQSVLAHCCLLAEAIFPSLQWAESAPKPTQWFFSGICLLISCQAESLSLLLPIGRGYPSFSAVWPSPPEHAREKSQREYERDGNHSLLWPNNRGAAHHFCHVLLVRRESPDLKWRRSLGGYVEAFCHSPLISSPVSHPLIPVVF